MQFLKTFSTLLVLTQGALAADSRVKETLQTEGPASIVTSRTTSAVTGTTRDIHIVFSRHVINVGAPTVVASSTLTGAPAATPVVGLARTVDFRDYTVTLSGLQDNARYTVSFGANLATECTPSFGGCTTGFGALRNRGSNTFSFDVMRAAVLAQASSVSLATITTGTTKVPFTVSFGRAVVPVGTGNFASAKDAQGEDLKIRDVTFSRMQWKGTVTGKNANTISFNLAAGAASDMAGNPSVASSPANLMRTLRVPTNCDFEEVAGPWSACVDGRRSRNVQSIIISQPLFGGVACPAESRVQVDANPCGAGATGASCANVCGAMSADGSCSCQKDCGLYGNCCADIVRFCPAPECGTHLYCNGDARTEADEVVCSCKAGCARDGNCCESFADSCTDVLCAFKFPPAATGTPSFCTRKWVEATDSAQICNCDDECMVEGDCCADFAKTCSVQTTCSKPKNCGLTFTTDDNFGCNCDHACVAVGDCCDDYTSVCESAEIVTCAGSCGSMAWDDAEAFANTQAINRWCSCDDECAINDDCCGDIETACPAIVQQL